MEPNGVFTRAKFDGRTLPTAGWDTADRAPGGLVASGGPPAQGGSGGPPPKWRARVVLADGSVLEGNFSGLRPAGPATLVECGGATYTVEYDGSRTVAEWPVPMRKDVEKIIAAGDPPAQVAAGFQPTAKASAPPDLAQELQAVMKAVRDYDLEDREAAEAAVQLRALGVKRIEHLRDVLADDVAALKIPIVQRRILETIRADAAQVEAGRQAVSAVAGGSADAGERQAVSADAGWRPEAVSNDVARRTVGSAGAVGQASSESADAGGQAGSADSGQAGSAFCGNLDIGSEPLQLRLEFGGGGALSDAEREQIVAAALTEEAVDGGPGTRFFEDPYELKMGRSEDAARGLKDRMRADPEVLHARMEKPDGIDEEAGAFLAASLEHCEELRDIIDYVLHQRTSEREYPNGVRDKGRSGRRLSHFATHENAQRAGLTEGEVSALRIYTTLAYRHMNNPLRDDERYDRRESVPLPTVSSLADSAIRKLRGVRARMKEQEVVVWRGMRSVRVTEAFMQGGGTELAFMSTTRELSVAVRYSLSRHSLLLRIVSPSFMSFGAELQWLSAFSGEAEVLFPPLTFLKPTGRTDRVDAVDRDGNPVTFNVVEVIPYI